MLEQRIPKDLREAIEILTEVCQDNLGDIMGLTEREFGVRCHHFLGQNMRNAWGLWYDETPISQWFAKHEINHGDDRSAIIIDSFHRSLHGRDPDIEGQKKEYAKFWKGEGFADGIFRRNRRA